MLKPYRRGLPYAKPQEETLIWEFSYVKERYKQKIRGNAAFMDQQ